MRKWCQANPLHPGGGGGEEADFGVLAVSHMDLVAHWVLEHCRDEGYAEIYPRVQPRLPGCEGLGSDATCRGGSVSSHAQMSLRGRERGEIPGGLWRGRGGDGVVVVQGSQIGRVTFAAWSPSCLSPGSLSGVGEGIRWQSRLSHCSVLLRAPPEGLICHQQSVRH